MASLLRKLQGPSAQSRGSAVPTVSTPSSPSSTQMFLLEVIAFGEVYAVPVTKATPATVVLRYVMEAAVSQEDAARMGNVEATLYWKERPLPLDTLMGKLPRRAVLHLHSSLSATSAVVRDRRQSAVSMLSQDRQRFSHTTVTMQPVLKDGSGAREGSGSTAGGLSSERSPSADPISLAPSMYAAGQDGMPMFAMGTTAPVMMFTPMMVPMLPATAHAGYAAPSMVPYYCCMPVESAAGGVRMLGPQGRTVSAPCLSASRRRDSAVEFANGFHFPQHENPLNSAAAATADASRRGTASSAEARTTSPRPCPPGTNTAARRFSAPVSDTEHHIVIYLRLPRDRAAARLSAAALSGDSNVEMSAVAPEEVPQAELMNATFSTVATNTSQLPRAYAYRRLRVRKDFPVGTLRDLCAVDARHRLHLAHEEIADERVSFAGLGVPANAVFYFKAAATAGSPERKARTLTRERLREHLQAGAGAAVAAGKGDREGMAGSPAPSPSHIDVARPSKDRSVPSPVPSKSEPRRHINDRSVTSLCTNSSVASSQSIHERIEAFNGEAVRNPGCADETPCVEGDVGLVASPSSSRYVVEGRELTITSAVATEQARRLAEVAARQAEVEAEEAAEREWGRRLSSSSPSPSFGGDRAAALTLQSEDEDVDVDVDVLSQVLSEAPNKPTLPTARGTADGAGRHMSPDPTPQALSATSTAEASKKGKALGEKKGAFRWMGRRASAASSSQSSAAASRTSSTTSSVQRGPHPARLSRVAKVHSRRAQTGSGKRTATAATASTTEKLPCVPLVPDDVATGVTSTEGETAQPDAAAAPKPVSNKTKSAKPKVKKEKRSGTPVPPSPELHSVAVSEPRSRPSSRSSSLGASFKAKLQRLTRRASKDGAARTPAKSPSPAAASLPLAGGPPTPATASEEALDAMKRKSQRVSRKKAAVAAAAAAAAVQTVESESTAAAATTADTAPAAVAAAALVKEKPRRTSAVSPSASTASSTSYSERRRQSADAVPRQPVSFLGSDPAKRQPLAQTAAAVNTLEEASATLGPAALSTTRVPSPRNSPTPVSILVSPSPEQRRRDSSAERTRMTEANINDRRRAEANATPESRAATPDYSVESSGSVNRLRITIRDPEDGTRFHYGVPVEPECPVGAMREWITAMQHPLSSNGKAPPSLRDVDRYGVFAGDTYLADEGNVTFGEVTCGRNDVVFSVRPRI